MGNKLVSDLERCVVFYYTNKMWEKALYIAAPGRCWHNQPGVFILSDISGT